MTCENLSDEVLIATSLETHESIQALPVVLLGLISLILHIFIHVVLNAGRVLRRFGSPEGTAIIFSINFFSELYLKISRRSQPKLIVSEVLDGFTIGNDRMLPHILVVEGHRLALGAVRN